MKRIIIILLALIFISLSITSCQKAKEPEQKKEAQVQKAQVEEVKQKPLEIQHPETKAETQSEPPPQKIKKEVLATPPVAPTEEAAEFKEPVLLWEREFDPPLIDISDQNSAGEYIAIQGGGKEGRPTKILFLDSKGKTVREIPLSKKEKRKIPPEQVWLTYYGEQWRDEEFKKGFVEGIEIETEVYKVFVSGNGEYYGIVTWDTKFIEPEYHSPWYEFAYYDKTGKLLWKHVPDVNYGFMNAHISYDGSRIILIDEAILDYFGQKWYLYDEKGKLIKAEDHLLRATGTQEEWDRKKGEWIRTVKVSENGKYIAYIKGEPSNSKAGLMDNSGKILWEKQIDREHHYIDINDDGLTILHGENRKGYLIGNSGEIFYKFPEGVRPTGFSRTRHHMFAIESTQEKPEQNLILYDSISLDLVLKIKVSDIFGKPDIKIGGIESLVKDSIIFYYGANTMDSVVVFDINKKKEVWKKEKFPTKFVFPRIKGKNKELLFRDSLIQTRKIKVFSLANID